MDLTVHPASADRTFEEVLAEYLSAKETGAVKDREELLARYPDHAAELREFFSNRDQMQQFARPLQAPVRIFY